MVAPADELFRCAVTAWTVEPCDGNAVDEPLVLIVRSDMQAAMDLACRHLTDEDVDVRGTAWQLPAVTAQLGDEHIRASIADLAIAAHSREHEPDILVGIVRALGGSQDERGLASTEGIGDSSRLSGAKPGRWRPADGHG